MVGLAFGLIFVTVLVQIAIFCCRDAARKVPLNYILLFIFTACESFILAVICSSYPSGVVLQAAGATAAVTIALTAYACTTKTDFTICGGLMFILSMVIFTLIIAMMFLSFAAWWHPLVSALLIVFYGLFLIYDTQLIAGGRKHELSLDDYVIGALIIYVDIIVMFLQILRVLGGRR